MFAVENAVLGTAHDTRSVNMEPKYHESCFRSPAGGALMVMKRSGEACVSRCRASLGASMNLDVGLSFQEPGRTR